MFKQCYFKQNFTPKLFFAVKMAYYCRFRLGGILDFLQKSFITSTMYLINRFWMETEMLREIFDSSAFSRVVTLIPKEL